jgi:hypothetical protein
MKKISIIHENDIIWMFLGISMLINWNDIGFYSSFVCRFEKVASFIFLLCKD